MTAEPSPRPWRIAHPGEIEDANGELLYNLRDCIGGCVDEANAALIVDAVNQIGNARGIAKTAVNEYAELGERRNRLLSAMKAIEDLCKVLDRTDLWEAREEWLDDAIYYIRKEARAAIKENEE